jgi:hypothetical protein
MRLRRVPQLCLSLPCRDPSSTQLQEVEKEIFMKTRFRFVALAVAATMGLGSMSAFAQDHRHDGGGQGGWQQQRGERGRGEWARNEQHGARGYYAPSYGYRRDDGDVVGAVVLGALTGALVGQAAGAYNYNPQPPVYYNPPPATYYNPGYGYYGN